MSKPKIVITVVNNQIQEVSISKTLPDVSVIILNYGEKSENVFKDTKKVEIKRLKRQQCN